MIMPRRLFFVLAGCFTFFLIGAVLAVRADEKDDLEKKKLDDALENEIKAAITAFKDTISYKTAES